MDEGLRGRVSREGERRRIWY